MPVTVAATVTPSGNFPATDSVLNKGGYMAVADITARNAIHSSRRVEGMLVGVASVDAIFRLAADLTTWQQWGSRVVVTQSTHGFSVGNVIANNGTIFIKAKADDAPTAESLGFVVKVTDVNTFTYALPGSRVEVGLSGLTAGLPYYISPTTAGAITATEPTTVGHISVPVIKADSATSGIFVNQRGATVEAPGTPGTTDALSDLVDDQIEITNAGTGLTLNRFHVLKATTGAQSNELPVAASHKGAWIGIRIDPTSTKLVTIQGNIGDNDNIGPGTAAERVMHGGESAYLLCDGNEWTKTHGMSIPIEAFLYSTVSNLSLATGTTPAKITTMNTPIDNVGGLTGVGSASAVVTVLRAGIYDIQGLVQITFDTEATRVILAAALNGSTTPWGTAEGNAQVGAPTFIFQSRVLTLAAGDTVELRVSQNSGVNQDVVAGTSFSLIERPSW